MIIHRHRHSHLENPVWTERTRDGGEWWDTRRDAAKRGAATGYLRGRKGDPSLLHTVTKNRL